jgi:hypothetical protein
VGQHSTARKTTVFGRKFHNLTEKSSFFPDFCAFRLAFLWRLGYSPERPEFFRYKNGVVEEILRLVLAAPGWKENSGG